MSQTAKTDFRTCAIADLTELLCVVFDFRVMSRDAELGSVESKK